MFLNIKIKTNAKKNEVIKNNNNYIVKTTTSPEKGKANKDIINILSNYFKIGKNKIKIIKGEKSHNKIIEIEL